MKKGSHHKKEAKEINRIKHLGKTAWNKGLKGWSKGTRAGFQKGHGHFDGAEKGWFTTERTLKEKNVNWKNGITKLNHAIRTQKKYIKWRLSIFQRDKYRCQECSIRGRLHVHHIIPVRKIIKIYKLKSLEEAFKCSALWDISNGITLCEKCHAKIDPYWRNAMGIKNG